MRNASAVCVISKNTFLSFGVYRGKILHFCKWITYFLQMVRPASNIALTMKTLPRAMYIAAQAPISDAEEKFPHDPRALTNAYNQECVSAI